MEKMARRDIFYRGLSQAPANRNGAISNTHKPCTGAITNYVCSPIRNIGGSEILKARPKGPKGVIAEQMDVD
jgi:hypothetical protein